MMGVWRKAKAKVTHFWETKIARHLSTRTRKYIGILAIPGMVLKIGAVAAAGASMLHIVAPYMLGVAAFTTTAWAGLIARDIWRNKNTIDWTNQAGQKIRSSRLAREELRDIQKKLNKFSGPSKKHDKEAGKLSGHFNRFAAKVTVLEDVPSGDGRFRFIYQGKSLLTDPA